MEKFITLTDNSDVTHNVRIGAITKYTSAGGFGVHSVVLFDNGQFLNVAETVGDITDLIAAALSA